MEYNEIKLDCMDKKIRVAMAMQDVLANNYMGDVLTVSDVVNMHMISMGCVFGVNGEKLSKESLNNSLKGLGIDGYAAKLIQSAGELIWEHYKPKN